MAEPVTILGAGLAGCEAAWQLANRGIPVTLWEMKPDKMPTTPPCWENWCAPTPCGLTSWRMRWAC